VIGINISGLILKAFIGSVTLRKEDLGYETTTDDYESRELRIETLYTCTLTLVERVHAM
jgi:hypothetical protein